jgi:hypothetical protein
MPPTKDTEASVRVTRDSKQIKHLELAFDDDGDNDDILLWVF